MDSYDFLLYLCSHEVSSGPHTELQAVLCYPSATWKAEIKTCLSTPSSTNVHAIVLQNLATTNDKNFHLPFVYKNYREATIVVHGYY